MEHESLLKEGYRSFLAGEYKWARECYENAAVFLPDSEEPYIGLGIIEIEEGNIEEAEMCFRVACRLDPKSSRAHCGIGVVEHRKCNYQKAGESYLKSYLLDRSNLSGIYGLFEVSRKTGSYELLKLCLERYIEDHPDDYSMVLSLGCLYLKDNQQWKARLVFSNTDLDIEGKLKSNELCMN